MIYEWNIKLEKMQPTKIDLQVINIVFHSEKFVFFPLHFMEQTWFLLKFEMILNCIKNLLTIYGVLTL